VPALLAAAFVLTARPAAAHVAVSSVELRVSGRTVQVSVVGQAIDFAHELGVDPPERLVDLDFLEQKRQALDALMNAALTLAADGAPMAAEPWSPAAAPEEQLVRLRSRFTMDHDAGRLTLTSRLFAYDTQHQTIVTVYNGETVATQQMLDAARASYGYFLPTRAGRMAALTWFSRAGFEGMLTGYDHLLFLVALLLVGGSGRRIGSIVAAFVAACLCAFALGVKGLIPIPAFIFAPGVALSVVYAGVDNLMMRGGRDVRVWIASAFGAVHGLAFYAAFTLMDRPPSGAGWAGSAYAAGIGAAAALAAGGVVAIVALASSGGPEGPPYASRPMAHASPGMAVLAGSAAIALAGAASFIRHVWLPH
jgi:hypothetical protein